MSDPDYKTNPNIQAAGALMKQLGATHLIAFYRMPDGTVGYVSCGRGGRECKEAELVGEAVLSRMDWELSRRAGKRR